MNAIYKNIILNIKKQPLVWAFVLIYVLPPVGMAWLLAFGVMHVIHMLKSKEKWTFDPVGMLFMLTAIAAAGSALTSWKLLNFLSVPMIAAFYGIYLYLFHHIERLRLRRYLWVVIFGGLYEVISDKVFAVINHFIKIPDVISFFTGNLLLGFTKYDRLFGSAYNPNYACYLLILSLSFLLVEILRVIRLRNTQAVRRMLLMLVVIDFGIYQTGSRAGFIIMLVLHLMFLLLYNKWAFAGFTGLTVLLLPFIFHWMPRSSSTEMSFSTRLDIWKNSIYVFWQHPLFGATPLGFPDAYEQFASSSQSHPHNLFLAVFASSGVICGLFFTALILLSAYYLIRSFIQDKRHRYRATLFLFALPTIIEYGIMDFTLSSPQVMLVVLALSAFWINYLRQKGWLKSVHSILMPQLFHRFKAKAENKKSPALALTAHIQMAKKAESLEKY
ncbi:O-antigen ligase family protein [Sporolactobacillus spathodeae]|uniref:O-antigen ligase n=1 Tax=Sporolactobacillus spathodeae TaxID=1465502 RepID=A0ABS2Q8J3_9BACL|nr:O-antigen ligase family protein [Sporolactobacillus spathodeae]MBM7657489.1 O-antigen ligase [Sporolactobacillus spathodeae]